MRGAPLRVLRGGSWNNNANNCRSANRNRNTPDNRNNNIGFRVVVGARALHGQNRRMGMRRASVGESRACSGDEGDFIRKSTGRGRPGRCNSRTAARAPLDQGPEVSV